MPITFPVQDDVITEPQLGRSLRHAGSRNHVIEGGAVAQTVNPLEVEVPPVKTVVNGVYVETESTVAIGVPDNDISFITLELGRDVDGKVIERANDSDYLTFVVDESLQTKDRLFLAAVEASGGSIQQVVDARWLSPHNAVTTRIYNSVIADNTTSPVRANSLSFPFHSHREGRVFTHVLEMYLRFNSDPSSGIRIGLDWEFGQATLNYHAEIIGDSATQFVSNALTTSGPHTIWTDFGGPEVGMFKFYGFVGAPGQTGRMWPTIAQDVATEFDSRLDRGSIVRCTVNHLYQAANRNLFI